MRSSPLSPCNSVTVSQLKEPFFLYIERLVYLLANRFSKILATFFCKSVLNLNLTVKLRFAKMKVSLLLWVYWKLSLFSYIRFCPIFVFLQKHGNFIRKSGASLWQAVTSWAVRLEKCWTPLFSFATPKEVYCSRLHLTGSVWQTKRSKHNNHLVKCLEFAHSVFVWFLVLFRRPSENAIALRIHIYCFFSFKISLDNIPVVVLSYEVLWFKVE